MESDDGGCAACGGRGLLRPAHLERRLLRRVQRGQPPQRLAREGLAQGDVGQLPAQARGVIGLQGRRPRGDDQGAEFEAAAEREVRGRRDVDVACAPSRAPKLSPCTHK